MTTQQPLPQFDQGSQKKATTGISSGEVFNVPINRIHVDPEFNVRDKDADYKADVRRIADSIKANGFYRNKPLTGYVAKDGSGQDIILLTDGHTRLDAVELAVGEGAEITELPMIMKPRGTSMEDLTIELITGNDGSKVKPLAMARVIKRMLDYGADMKTIATRAGYGKAYLESLLDLLAAPKALRDLVETGKVSATLAVETIKGHGAKEAAKVLEAGVEVAAAKGKAKVTLKHVKATTEGKKAVAKKAGKKKAAPAQAELPLDTTPSVAEQKAAFLEKAGKWWIANAGTGAKPVDDVVALLAYMSDLEASEVAPYFEDDL